MTYSESKSQLFAQIANVAKELEVKYNSLAFKERSKVSHLKSMKEFDITQDSDIYLEFIESEITKLNTDIIALESKFKELSSNI